MPVQSVSIVVGSTHCNAHCPFCVSLQTGSEGVEKSSGKIRRINFQNLRIALDSCGDPPPTILLTGKGEPTLHPDEVTEYLQFLQGRRQRRPLGPVEIQTNGLAIGRLARDGRSGVEGLDERRLRQWRQLDLSTIAVSAVSIHDAANATIYHPDYPPIRSTIKFLRSLGFTVRLCIMMMHGDGCIFRPIGFFQPTSFPSIKPGEAFDEVVQFCLDNDVGQLTMRPIVAAYASQSERAAKFVEQHAPTEGQTKTIHQMVSHNGIPLQRLAHGATVFDYRGQDVCLSNCLLTDAVHANSPGETRSLIFFQDGFVTTSWDHPRAALILQGDPSYHNP